jgi:hypothetical protein
MAFSLSMGLRISPNGESNYLISYIELKAPEGTQTDGHTHIHTHTHRSTEICTAFSSQTLYYISCSYRAIFSILKVTMK